MNGQSDHEGLSLHLEPDLFRESINFTATRTGFLPRLIEKDYYCSLLLDYLRQSDAGTLVFKGGTCLAKVHAGFYRLSEDLDFVIPIAVDSKKKERSARIADSKTAVAGLPDAHPCFRIVEPMTGRNESRQYLATAAYASTLDGHQETIKLEIGLREPLLTETITGDAQTVMMNAANPDIPLPGVPFPCLSFDEAMAEKLRAALTRREVAIRDFFDIDYAIRTRGLEVSAPRFVELVRAKVSVPGNDPASVAVERLELLHNQLEARLRPVLRERDFVQFDLDRAVAAVKQVAEALGVCPTIGCCDVSS